MSSSPNLGTGIKPPTAGSLTAAPAPIPSWRSPWRRALARPATRLALGLIGAMAAFAVLAPLLMDLLGLPDPSQRDTAALSQTFGTATGPSSAHPLGVDDLGRDVLSRVLAGARISLFISIAATALTLLAGTLLGLLAGYRGGLADMAISRVMDVMLAVPYLLLAAGIAASCSLGGGCLGGVIQPGIGTVIFVISLASWAYAARLTRGEVLSLRETDFVLAARASGMSEARLILTEILPNLLAPLIVFASVFIPQAILYEAALSFLGVGVSSITPSWGQMLAEATPLFPSAWWYMLFPGLALFITVMAFNVLGERIREAFTPYGAAR